MKALKIIPLLVCLPALPLAAQSTVTAASSSYTDVNAVINGPTHVAVNGDTIQIPCSSPTSVLWSNTLTVNANITLTALGATPNTLPSQFGAGTNCLTIIHATATAIQLNPVYNSTHNLTTVQNITFQPSSRAYNPIKAYCTATSSGQPNVRFDNLIFGNGTAQYQYGTGSNTGEFLIIENNCFGVADHNSTATGNQTVLLAINNSTYYGVGNYGDNSWAQPDSMGDINKAFYVENNDWHSVQWPIIENEDFATEGGGRAVVRFNHATEQGVFFLAGSSHGTDTSGRPRSNRHTEIYGNNVACVFSTVGLGNYCYDLHSFRGGTGRVFGNTLTQSGGATWKEGGAASTERASGDGWIQWNYGGCGGATSGNAKGAFDLNDGVVYDSGTFTSGTSGTHIVDSTKSWTTNHWSANGGTNYIYYFWDVTQGWVSAPTSNSATAADVIQAPHGYINGATFINAAPGDSYQIVRSKGCLDGAGMGQSAAITSDAGQKAILISTGLPGPANPAFDPIYIWDNTSPGYTDAVEFNTSSAPQMAADRNYFSDNSLGSPQVQTSPTTPFNGTSGVGFGTLANRPTTCTPNPNTGVSGVGYFATDQGSWNTSGNGFGQGILYQCLATNTWTPIYTPGCYPHPLAGGSCGGTNYTLTVAATNGSVSGSNCSTNTYASGTSIGACTATPNAGYTFTGWSGGGCSGTGSCSFALTSNTTLTATFTATSIPLTVTATNGSVSGTNCSSGSYSSGTSIGACTATPNTGYTFTGWSSTGSAFCSGTGTCGPFSLTTASTITATFTVANYTVSTASAGTGSGTITGCAGTHHYSDSISCTVTPNAGSTVTTVTGGGGTWTSSPYTFTMPASNVTVTATFQATAAAPTYSPVAGSYLTAQNVTISDTTHGSAIHYTTDGSTPNCSSTTYTTPVNIASTSTLKSLACATGYTNSSETSGLYTIAACTVSFSPSAGTYTSGQTVTISTSGCLAGTQVFYRTDGLPATNIDTQYSVPIVVPVTQTLTAKAVLSPTVRDQPQTISTQKKCNAVGSPITFPSGYSCTNGSGGVAGTASDFKFTAGTSNQMYVTTTDNVAFDTSILLIDTPTATDNNIVAMSHREVYQDTSNCSQTAPNKYKCVDVSETDSESCCDTVTHALWQMSVRCSTNVSGSSGNNGFLEGDASSGSEKWDIPCVIGAATDLTVNSHWTQHDTGCGGSGCMVLDSIYLNGTKYAFPASCDAGDTNCPNYPMTPQPTYGNFIAGSQDQVYARNVGVAGTSPLTTTRSISFARVGVDEGTEATGSAAYVITPSSSGNVTIQGNGVKISGSVGVQ